MITIIDAGLGNPRSCQRMLEYLDVPSTLLRDPAGLASAERVILPGVGHFDAAMRRLREGGWVEPIRAHAASGRPLLGICLGMQLLGTGSTEGVEPGLGLLPWRSERLPNIAGVRIPHMGWNEVRALNGSRLHAAEAKERFYFVHGFYVPADALGVSAVCTYGIDIGCTIEFRNLYGAQFHPEKSHRYGMGLLRRYSELTA